MPPLLETTTTHSSSVKETQSQNIKPASAAVAAEGVKEADIIPAQLSSVRFSSVQFTYS